MDADPKLEVRIGEGLVKRGSMEQQDVEAVLKLQRAGDERLFGEIAVDLGYIEVRELMDYLRT